MKKRWPKLFDGPEGVYYEPSCNEIYLLEQKHTDFTVNGYGELAARTLYRVSCSHFQNDTLGIKASTAFMYLGPLNSRVED